MQVRSRMVARKFKSDDRPDLRAGTPPLEALKATISIAANHKDTFSVMHIDVSRAYFHEKVRRLVLVRLPVEDSMGADAGNLSLLNKGMYGTRDAASNWERDRQEQCKKLALSTWTQLEESVSPGTAPSFRTDTWRRLRAHGTDRTTGII